MSFIEKTRPSLEERDNFNTIMHLIVIVLSELNAGCIEFQDVLGVRRQPVFKEFVNFLQMMEIYGGGYNDDVDYFRYNIRQDKTHSQSMIDQLEKVVLCYKIALKYIE